MRHVVCLGYKNFSRRKGRHAFSLRHPVVRERERQTEIEREGEVCVREVERERERVKIENVLFSFILLYTMPSSELKHKFPVGQVGVIPQFIVVQGNTPTCSRI